VTEELMRGGRAGADLLSLKESTLAVADEVGSIPVLSRRTWRSGVSLLSGTRPGPYRLQKP
jgi:hypothetical protein